MPSAPEQLVSVVIPTLNPGRRLERALRSVREQGAWVAEVLLVDGGSSDGSLPATRDPRLRIMGSPGLSLVDAWRLGISQARSPWIALLDSDDRWTSGGIASHVERVRSVQREGLEVAGVTGRVRFVQDGDVLPPQFRASLLSEQPYGWMPGSTLISADLVSRAGLPNGELGVASDIEWIDRLRSQGRFLLNDHVVLEKSVSPDSVSMAATEERASWHAYERDVLAAVRSKLRSDNHAQ